MNSISRLRYFLYLSILIIGCTTGKNALQKGDYDAAVSKAVDRLRSSPQNKEAMQVLPEAFNLAIKTHLRKIDEAKASADGLKWENIMYRYQKINQLSDEVNACPSCLNLVPNPPKYIKEFEDSRYRAAEARYLLGERSLRENNRQSAKVAYHHFVKAQSLYPSLKGVKEKIEDAYWAAVLKVVVQPAIINSNTYRLSNQYFQEQIANYLATYKGNTFVRFYSEEEAAAQKLRADQLVELHFDDFIVGQTYVKERIEKLQRDSVVIGENRRGKIYGTVKATYSVFEKQVSSSGLLNFAVVDLSTNKLLRNQKIAGTYVWKDYWASFRGDERALDRQQLALTRKREVIPPPPGNLFVEFTKPIYAQLVDHITSFYSRY
ncbi:hypothetical protein [Pedobacter nanyangensis]|uniref:hypothetical protein n=1 Tax=Pedobacter nanyangensis TaxID=1562389 RepID=UPI000DE1F3D7|nr:hypothetical protein [Pedobacter nanyangensis]